MKKTNRSIGLQIKKSFSENIRPGLVLQALALTIVLLYFLYQPFHNLLDQIGQWKAEGNLLISGIITMFFGGLFPFLLLFLTGKINKEKALSLGIFYMLFWLWKGMEVDLLYRFQAFLFGDSNQWQVVLKKVITDQFIYGPLWAAPTMMIFYLWKDSDFNFTRMKEKLQEEDAIRRIIPVLASNMVVWIPAVTIVYMLPLSLQFPLFNLVLVFWTLILNSVAAK